MNNLKAKNKITLATFKSFVKKNRENLLVKVGSSFSGMTDMCEPVDDHFTPAEDNDHFPTKNSLGIGGIYLVGSSRDRFRYFENENLVGIEVYNACGNFTVAVKSDLLNF